jgi:hypothetical protein
MEATAVMERMRRSSMATRMESMMARVTVAAGTAIVRRRTATTNMPTMVTAQAMATEITTNKLTGRRMNADTRKATSVVVVGAATNLFTNEQKPCGGSHGFYFLRCSERNPASAPGLYAYIDFKSDSQRSQPSSCAFLLATAISCFCFAAGSLLAAAASLAGSSPARINPWPAPS